jgi:hypothetical protein
MKEQDHLRFPIGKFEYGKSYTTDAIRKNIKIIENFPKILKKTLKKATRDQLDTTYRPGGWTIRQVVHHLADSHMNAYIRTKLALTEQAPIIKTYEEKEWAELEDAKNGSIKNSIKIVAAVHARWTKCLLALSDDDLEKAYYHPGSKRLFPIAEIVALYAWHAQHHLGHIKIVVKDTDQSATTKTNKSTDKAPAAKTAKAAAKPKKAAKPASDGPKMTRAEILAKARAARQVNLAAAGKAPAAKPEKAAAKKKK